MVNGIIKGRDNMDKDDVQSFNFSDFVTLPNEYYSIDRPKQRIAKAIKSAIENKHLSLRKLGDKIEGMDFSQISRITTRKNYNIDTLLKVLHALDLEIEIKPKIK